MRKLAVLVALVGSLLAVSTAQAAPTSIFDGAVSCTTQPVESAYAGQTWCGTGQHDANNGTRSTVESFDGVPIDVNVAFPDEAQYSDGPYPLVYMFHGYGGGKFNFSAMDRWLDRGYAVLSQTNRGFHESCGTASAKEADPDCETKGFVRLDDTRYEVRDAQLFAGMLVDEGLVQPTKIAATGGSYGGGMSMALAALKDRIMLPDGTYDDWESPNGTPMSLAVATPNVPWTDLAYSLVPNGSNVDYIKDASYFGPFGVMKQSYVNALYLGGLLAPGYYTAAGVQPEADLSGWKAFMDAGEPYEGKAQAEQMLDEITSHHSSYYIDHSQAPAPLLISSGFTDDLFPANEATRFYNRTRAQYPNAPISLFFGSFGHPRGQSGPEVSNALRNLENSWLDYYLKGVGEPPASEVTTFTQVCPDGATDGGPFTTSDWVSQSPGEIRQVFDGSQTVTPDGGDRANGSLFSPNPAGLLPAPAGTACAEGTGATEAGTANYELAAAPAGGYTVMGAATAIAKIEQQGDDSTLAFRLVDVTPDGSKKILVSRTAYRSPGDGFQVVQLNSNGWHVEEGHKLRLEVLPFDGGSADPAGGTLNNYSRPSNLQQPATIAELELRIPVQQEAGSLDGLVKAPAKRVMPDRPGAELAPGNEAIGSETLAEYVSRTFPCPAGTTGPGAGDCSPNSCPVGQIGSGGDDCRPPVVGNPSLIGKATVKGKRITLKLRCKIGNDSCRAAKVVLKGAPRKGKKGKRLLIVRKGGLKVTKPGQTKTFHVALSGKARKFFRDKRVRKRGKKRLVRGPKALRAKVTINGKSAGFTNVKRVGKVR